MQIDLQTGVSLALVIALAGAIWRGGKLEGKVTQVLESLRTIVADHEERIRKIEGKRRK